MSSLVVPVVVWGGGGTGQNSPTHRVSSLLLTPDCTTLISGSVDGHIILWKLKLDQTLWNAQTEATLEPISVLLGHTAQVTALCVANEANAPISATSCAVGGAKGTFLSASENGDVCLWDISDGRCLEVNRFQGHHIGMQRLPVREQSGIRVLVWGYYSDILVIDGCSLCHLFSLSSRLHPDWASAVTLVRPIVKAGKLKVRMVENPAEKWNGSKKRQTLKQMTAAASASLESNNRNGRRREDDDEDSEQEQLVFQPNRGEDETSADAKTSDQTRVRKTSLGSNETLPRYVGSTNNDPLTPKLTLKKSLSTSSLSRTDSALRSNQLKNVRLANLSSEQNLHSMQNMWNSNAAATASYESLHEFKGHQSSSRKKKSSVMANQRIVYRQLIRGKDVVVALTLSGHVKVWSLSSTDRKEMEFIPEEQSKSIRCMNPCHMTCCSANQKLLLIITEAEWFLYDLDDFVKLCGGIAPPHPASTTGGASCVVHTWSRGSFLTVDKIAVWTKQGMCVVYQLPPDVNPENKRYRSKLDSSKEEHLKILASFDAHEDYIRSQKESKSEDDENGLKMFDFDSATNILAPDCVSASQFSNMGFVFASGNEEGFLSIHVLPSSILSIDGKTKNWDPSMLNKKIHCLSSTSLAHVWEKFKPSGLVDHLVDENGASHKVTSSLYLAQYGNLACGREDGSIVLIPAIEHAALKLLAPQYTKQLGLPSYFVMRGGHYSKVTCLLYPYQDSHRYDRSLFVSGGMDFSVVIWNLLSGQLIRRFVNHAGQVERLFIPPDTCGPRIRQCVVSVSSDHGVNLTSLSERNTILMAGCHLFPVKTVKWKPSHDFMLVQTTDGTLYVWHLSSGYLDRVIQGSEAEDILSACDEMEHEVTIRGNLKDAFKRRNVDALKDMAIQQITDLAVQEKVGVNSRGDSNRKRDGAGTSASPSGSFSGLNICPIRLSDGDPFFHVLFFDTEALVIQLLNCDKRRPTTSSSPPATPVASEKFKPEFERLEEVRRLTQSSSNFTDKVSKLGNKLLENVKKEIVSTTATAQTQMQGTNLQSSSDSSSAAEAHSNRKPTSNMSLPLVDVEGYLESSQDDAADFETPALDPAQQEAEQEQLTCETAQLMMSLLFAWGFNPSLDRLCVELLGLFRPSDSVCFGVTSRPGYLTLSLPSPKTISERHWSVSSSLTTQHRLSIITLSNALMSMRVPILAQKLLDKVGPSSYPDIFQGWSSVAALHCVLFPDMAPGEAQMADLEQLVRRWQDRCLEVREAAQALLLAELKHIGSRGRQNLVDIWASHLPLLGSDPNNQHPPQPSNTLPTPQGSSTSFSNASSVASSPKHSGVQPGVHAANSSYPQSTGQMQGDNHSDGNSVDDDDSLGSMTAITSASNPTQSTKLSRHEAQRRQGTAIVMLGVLGAEFGQSVSESGSFQSDGSFLEGFSGANMSLARYTCQALSHLLLHPPKGVDKQRGELRRAAIHLIGRGFTVWEPYMDITKVILALLEVASDTKVDYDLMFNGLPLLPEMDLLQTTHYALTQIATTRPSLFITSLAREVARFSAIMAAAQGPSTLSSSNMPSAVLARSKTEILRNVEILMDKQHHEVENLLLETMDIVLHCLDPGILKNKMLKNVFPSCNKFLAVDHCSTTRRVAAGGRRSVVHLYDSRALRPQVIQGPDEAQEGSSISCLCFSPDGKYLATFLAQLGKILFWQASSSFFNMIAANSFRVVKVAECPRLGISSGPVIKGRRFVTHRMVIILLSDGGEFRFTL